MFMRDRRVFPPAVLTFPALTFGAVLSGFHLSILGLAFGTCVHIMSLPHLLYLPHSRLIGLGIMQEELATLIGQRVDLLTVKSLHPMIRDTVLREAQIIYDAA